MNITIAGMGHAGTTVAADLTLKGHSVTLLKTSNRMHKEHHNYMFQNKRIKILENNVDRCTEIYKVTDDFSNAFKEAELVIIFIQTNYHEQVISRMLPYLKNGQVILIEPGYLSTSYFVPYCKEKNLTIIEAESSPIDCRIVSPGSVEVLFRNVRNPIGVYPSKQKSFVEKFLKVLGFNFIFTESVIEAALHNPNLIVHTVGAIMSMPRIEYTNGEYWMYKEVFTPSVWNIVEQLDLEKMNVLSYLGYKRLAYVEACKERNSHDDSRNALDVFFEYANNSSPKGPSIVNSRYITEDVPEGLVLLESLGRLLGINTPICTGLINCASAALQRDFRTEGRTIERLGQMAIKELLKETPRYKS